MGPVPHARKLGEINFYRGRGTLRVLPVVARWDPQAVKEELADVLTYCYFLAMKVGLEPDQIVLEKLAITAQKYPVEKSRGSSVKYDQL